MDWHSPWHVNALIVPTVIVVSVFLVLAHDRGVREAALMVLGYVLGAVLFYGLFAAVHGAVWAVLQSSGIPRPDPFGFVGDKFQSMGQRVAEDLAFVGALLVAAFVLVNAWEWVSGRQGMATLREWCSREMEDQL